MVSRQQRRTRAGREEPHAYGLYDMMGNVLGMRAIPVSLARRAIREGLRRANNGCALSWSRDPFVTRAGLAIDEDAPTAASLMPKTLAALRVLTYCRASKQRREVFE